MNTPSDPKFGAPAPAPNLVQGLGDLSQVPAGLPDPLALARLANQMLQNIPGTQGAPAAPAIPMGAAAALPVSVSDNPLATVPIAGLAASSSPFHGMPSPYTLSSAGIRPPDFGGGFPTAFGSDFSSLPSLGEPQDLTAPADPAGAEPYSFLSENRSLESFANAPAFPAAPFSYNSPNLRSSSDIFDVGAIRRDFPILHQRVNGHPLVWLDNGATTQKPQSVIDRLSHFYRHENSNVHRAAHELAARSTDAYESAREKVSNFLNASSPKEIVFVRGATEAINLVAQSFGRRHVGQGDEILITHLEHHANIVPWQMLASEKGAHLRVAPVDDTGQVILEEFEKLLGPRTKIVSVTQVSNALGTVTPVRAMVEMSHRYGATVLVDGAQAVSHMPVDVQSLGADFYVLSGHKMFAPTGIGVLFGKLNILDNMPPWQGGGNMIQDVTFEKTSYHPAPQRFEAGTGNIADAVGMGAAIDYLNRIGMSNINAYEHSLLEYGTEQLRRVSRLTIIGTAREKAGVLSFVLPGVKTEEVSGMLNREGIAVRSGHHCAQPILRRFGLESTVRASLAFYNTCEDIDRLVAALERIQRNNTFR